MKRRVATLVVSCALLGSLGGTATAAPPDGPSCVGVGSSSFAGVPGGRAELQRFVLESFEDLGFTTPGQAVVFFAKLHAGTLAECEALEQQALE